MQTTLRFVCPVQLDRYAHYEDSHMPTTHTDDAVKQIVEAFADVSLPGWTKNYSRNVSAETSQMTNNSECLPSFRMRHGKAVPVDDDLNPRSGSELC